MFRGITGAIGVIGTEKMSDSTSPLQEVVAALKNVLAIRPVIAMEASTAMMGRNAFN